MVKMFFRRYEEDIKVSNPQDNPYVFEKMFRGNPYIKEVTLHKNTIYIEEKTFKDCVSLEKINIPPKVQYLTSKMFHGCVSLREIIVENPIPPKYYPDKMCIIADEDVCDDEEKLYCVRLENLFDEKPRCFEGVDIKKCVLRVPKGSVELYHKAFEWKEFENIVEY